MNWGLILAFAVGAAAGAGIAYYNQPACPECKQETPKAAKGYVNGASFTTGIGYPGFMPARPSWATQGDNKGGCRACFG